MLARIDLVRNLHLAESEILFVGQENMAVTIHTPSARVEASFRKLSAAAQTLNSASDDLGKVIQQLDSSLKKLGLGISAWVEISGHDDGQNYWSRDLGYTRINNKWCIALRDVKGSHSYQEDEGEELWPFNEAPRWIRVEAVGKIPDLLEKLVQQAEDVTKKLLAKTVQTTEIANIVTALASGSAAQK